MDNIPVPDFHDFFNAISPSPDPAPAASHVSFDVRWHGGGKRLKLREDRKSTRLNSSHIQKSRMPSSA